MSQSIATASGPSVLIRWLVAIVAFPIAGTAGHAVAGPAATVTAALLSGLIAGAIIGLGQGIARGGRLDAIALWAVASAVGLGLALAAVTAAIGQIDATQDAVLLGAVSGLAIGVGQAAILVRDGITGPAWIWVPVTALAWAIGWAVTASVGVALAPGWPVHGLSGAVASQLITGLVLWKVVTRDGASSPARR